MACNLAAQGVERPARRPVPFADVTWGPKAAVLGVLLALAGGILLGILLAIPALIVEHPANGKTGTGVNVAAQLATALGFLVVPIAVAGRRDASLSMALRRLGLRSFRPSAVAWMAAAVGAYLVIAAVYVALFGSPKQKDIAEGFGALPIQILLIAIAAPVSEEICFRGMLFGGLRRRLPRIAAALVSAAIFGVLHALTGLSAVPPLIAFGFILALLYEKTGSIVPGILLHILNNSFALLGQ